MRWKLEHRDRSLLARLVDEAGADQAVVVRRYDLRNPDRYVAVKTGDCYAGMSVPAPGALLSQDILDDDMQLSSVFVSA